MYLAPAATAIPLKVPLPHIVHLGAGAYYRIDNPTQIARYVRRGDCGCGGDLSDETNCCKECSLQLDVQMVYADGDGGRQRTELKPQGVLLEVGRCRLTLSNPR